MRRYKLYATDFDRNGTQDLIVTDVDGNILARRERCLYGLHVHLDKGQIAMNTCVITDPEMRKSLLDAPENLTFVYPVPHAVALRHVEADGFDDNLAFIQRYK